MSGSIVLKFQYMGKDVDVVVDDVDRVNLIDLVLEYWEGARKTGTLVPNCPTFAYVFKMKHWKLNNDKDLMEMFSRLPDYKCIYIWIGMVSEPTELVKAARKLYISKFMAEEDKTREHFSQPPLQTQPMSPPLSQIAPQILEPKKLTPRRSLSAVHNPSSLKFAKSSKVVGKKVPTTTAKRKGVFVSNKKGKLSARLSARGNTPRSRSLSSAIRGHIGNTDDSEGEEDDERYCPEESDREGPDDDDSDESLSDEDNEDVDEFMPLVEDNFDPYEGPAWDEIVGLNYDASYFDKLYQNGELYVNQEFGKIEIKPWLPDGQTWAIKSIKPAEHTCAGLETKNLMVSSKWAARGIDCALTEVWPTAGRRYCCKHLAANWKQPFPGPLMFSLFWKACGATSPFTFKKAMTGLQKANPAALVWLSKLGEQSRWTKHKFDPAIKCDVNKTNFVESFNATLGVDRCRPILTLLEGIRRVTMVRLATRRQVCEDWDREDICPNIARRVQVLCHESRHCKALLSDDGEFEILDGKSTLMVSLNDHTCLCGLWQLSGIPCKHGMRAILHLGLDPHRFVHNWYSVRLYKLAYGTGIKSVPDIDQWPDSDMPLIQPPKMKRGIERPSRNRKRADDETEKGRGAKQYNVPNNKKGTKASSSSQPQLSQPSSSQPLAKRTKLAAAMFVTQPVSKPLSKKASSIGPVSQP
ncbi:Protein FAR1-RELATED SEQUENCE 8 [Bienertia sinuspersici]